MLIIKAKNPPNNNIETVTQITWLSGAAKSFGETANFSPKKGRKILLWRERERERKAQQFFFSYIQYLSRGIQFSRASLNGALTKHKNKDIKTLKLDN